MTSLDTSDPNLSSAWTEMTKDESKVNWLLISVHDNKFAKLSDSGEGGIFQLKEKFDDSQVQFAVLKIEAIDARKNVTSRRVKYAFFTWIGENVPVMKKTKAAFQSQAIRKLFPGIALFVDVSHANEFDPNDLKAKLLQIGGAHKPTMFRFGPDCEIEVQGAATG